VVIWSPPRLCRLLVSTEAAGMGCDIPDINMSVILGLDSTEWKLSQKVRGIHNHTSNIMAFLQEGRAGRDGTQVFRCLISLLILTPQ
jgi:hypothetical protein